MQRPAPSHTRLLALCLAWALAVVPALGAWHHVHAHAEAAAASPGAPFASAEATPDAATACGLCLALAGYLALPSAGLPALWPAHAQAPVGRLVPAGPHPLPPRPAARAPPHALI